MRRLGVVVAAAGVLWRTPAALAQTAPAGRPPAGADQRVVGRAARAAVVAGVLDSLRAAYVFPDSVPAIAAALRRHERRGAYDGLPARALADSLTAHLRAARNDGHLRVGYAPEAPAPAATRPGSAPRPGAATTASKGSSGWRGTSATCGSPSSASPRGPRRCSPRR